MNILKAMPSGPFALVGTLFFLVASLVVACFFGVWSFLALFSLCAINGAVFASCISLDCGHNWYEFHNSFYDYWRALTHKERTSC